MNNSGYPAAFSQSGPLVTTTAPAVGLLCAGYEDNEYDITSGTSFGTLALVLLLIYTYLANLLSLSYHCWPSCLLLVYRYGTEGAQKKTRRKTD